MQAVNGYAPRVQSKLRDQKQVNKFLSSGNVKSLWDLYANGVTQGAINLFLECREQFRLTYKCGLSPRSSSDSIEFGSAFHHVLSEVHQNKCTISLALAHYEQRTRDAARLSKAERLDQALTLGQVETVAEAYFKAHKPADAGMEWVERERVFKFDIQFPAIYSKYVPGEFRSSFDIERPIPITGRIDGVFRKGKRLGNFETKTKSRVDEYVIGETQSSNIQTLLYCLAIKQRYAICPTLITYDVVKRPSIRLTDKDGTISNHCKRLADLIEENPKAYFMRWETTFTEAELERWTNNVLYPILFQMAIWNHDRNGFPDGTPSPYHWFNPNALLTRYNSRCALFDVLTNNSYYGLYQRKHCFPELID